MQAKPSAPPSKPNTSPEHLTQYHKPRQNCNWRSPEVLKTVQDHELGSSSLNPRPVLGKKVLQVLRHHFFISLRLHHKKRAAPESSSQKRRITLDALEIAGGKGRGQARQKGRAHGRIYGRVSSAEIMRVKRRGLHLRFSFCPKVTPSPTDSLCDGRHNADHKAHERDRHDKKEIVEKHGAAP